MTTLNPKLSKYIWYIIIKYKFYFCLLFIVTILASLLSIAVDYKIKEIIDIIVLTPSSNIGLLISLFVLCKLMHHGMYFISRLLDLKYKPILLVEIIENIYKKTIKHSLH